MTNIRYQLNIILLSYMYMTQTLFKLYVSLILLIPFLCPLSYHHNSCLCIIA